MRYGIILFILLVSGCGQKGALYMPNEKPETSAAAVSHASDAPVDAQDTTQSK